MNLLALDASTEYLSLAIATPSVQLRVHEVTGPAASQRILPEIQGLLSAANLTLKDLTAIVYGTGPGAFTGVRVAVGVAQGLAFGADLPLVGVSSLLTVAHAAWVLTQSEQVVVCLDARMGEVYHAAFKRQSADWVTLSAPTVCKPHLVPSLAGEGWVAAGTGWAVFGDALNAQYGQQINQRLPELRPDASTMLLLAEPDLLAGHTHSAHEAAPLYVRNRVALTASERAQGLTL